MTDLGLKLSFSIRRSEPIPTPSVNNYTCHLYLISRNLKILMNTKLQGSTKGSTIPNDTPVGPESWQKHTVCFKNEQKG